MNEISKKRKVFLSYAREDRETALKLYDDFRRIGIPVWLDEKSLLPGQNWKYEIRQAIKACSHFIVLISCHLTTKRGYVQKELRYALDLLDEFPPGEVFVIPIRLDESHVLHEKLEDIHRADLFPSYEEGFKKVVQTILATEKKDMEERNTIDEKLPKFVRKIILTPDSYPFVTHCIFKEIVFIGRSVKCDIPISQGPETISQFHAAIQYRKEENAYFISDTESRNGTLVNGEKIQTPIRLETGMQVHFSSTFSMIFRICDKPEISNGVFIYRTPKGKELARYVIAPQNVCFIGNMTDSCIRFPFFDSNRLIGKIAVEDDGGIYFYPNEVKNIPSRIMLENNGYIHLNSMKINIRIES